MRGVPGLAARLSGPRVGCPECRSIGAAPARLRGLPGAVRLPAGVARLPARASALSRGAGGPAPQDSRAGAYPGVPVRGSRAAGLVGQDRDGPGRAGPGGGRGVVPGAALAGGQVGGRTRSEPCALAAGTASHGCRLRRSVGGGALVRRQAGLRSAGCRFHARGVCAHRRAARLCRKPPGRGPRLSPRRAPRQRLRTAGHTDGAGPACGPAARLESALMPVQRIGLRAGLRSRRR